MVIRFIVTYHDIFFSYSIMNQCWQLAPEERPTFKELHLTISAYIEQEACYLQLGLNPFVGRFAGSMKEVEVEDDGEDGEVRKEGEGGGDDEGGEGEEKTSLEVTEEEHEK